MQTKKHFAELALPTNHYCGTGTQISDSGPSSTVQKFLAPTPTMQNCLGSNSTALSTTHTEYRCLLIMRLLTPMTSFAPLHIYVNSQF